MSCRGVVLCRVVSLLQREEHDHLFGDERGQLKLQAIEVVRVLDEDPSVLEIISSNFKNRHFKCASLSECEEWVSALRSAIKSHALSVKKRSRAKSIYNPEGQKFLTEDVAEEYHSSGGGSFTTDVKVILVSLGEPDKREEVIAHNPQWGRLVVLSDVAAEDELVISMSNGGSVKIPSAALQDKSASGRPFQVDIKNVPLASSLQIVVREAVTPQAAEGQGQGQGQGVDKQGRFAGLRLVFQKITGDTAVSEWVGGWVSEGEGGREGG
jgi:hypothetical protein